MKIIEPGHIYFLDTFDQDGKLTQIADHQRLIFVNRESGTEHDGTQTQEVLRANIDSLECLIDRTNHCDACLRWEGNDRIIKAISEAQRQLRLALLYHEQRALERKVEKDGLLPEALPTGTDGHFQIGRGEYLRDEVIDNKDGTESVIIDGEYFGTRRKC
jgi:hypothetical protein